MRVERGEMVPCPHPLQPPGPVISLMKGAVAIVYEGLETGMRLLTSR